MKNEKNYEQFVTVLIKSRKITNLRRKYDPDYSKKIPNHLNLVYFISGINQKALCNHISKSIERIKPFKVKFNKFWKFKSNPYIYITSDDGFSRFMNLYKKLNKSILKNFKNKYMPNYIPHITLTYFDSNKKANELFEHLKKEKLYFEVKIDSIQLLTQYENHSIKSIKNFKLQ